MRPSDTRMMINEMYPEFSKDVAPVNLYEINQLGVKIAGKRNKEIIKMAKTKEEKMLTTLALDLQSLGF